MGKQHDLSFKQMVLESIKNGTKVSEVCVQHSLSPKTVYAWLRSQADNTGTSSLELAKLKKDNQDRVGQRTWHFTLRSLLQTKETRVR